jgi:DNA gyrase subunit B
MTEPKNVIYDDHNIKTLDNITAIRLRPAMYIESLGEMGLFKIDSEAVQNIFDEFLVGRCTSCFIDYDSVTNRMIVRDDASGIPIGKLVDIFTKSHTGGKFNREAYQISAGQNGIGNKLINALSTYLKVEVWREGYFNPGTKEEIVAKHAIVEFERGILKNEFYEDVPGSTKHGTTLEYYTDDEILKTHTRNINRFAEYLNLNSYLLPGIYIEMKIDGQKTVFQHTGGINELYVDRFIKGKKIKTIFDPIYVFGNEDMFSFEIVFSYNHLNSGDGNIVSAVNGNNTPMHGVHVSSFRAGASLALTDYVKENNDLIPKALKNVNISGTLIGDNIVAVVTVKHRNPLYSGQTKEAFKSDEVQEPIKQMTRRVFGKWLRDNPQQAKKLVGIMIDYAKYEEERKKLKKNLIETKAAKSAFAANGIDPAKYTRCRSNNPEECEIFIVEGDSAGGNVELAQDRQFQALYCLTGKILNVIKSGNNIGSKVILELIQALGMGLPGNGTPNYKNLQYNKIVVLTDADDDGAHIATLLSAFLYKYYPKVIEDGHLFIANPPIKKLTMSNGSYFYIHTEADYDRLMSKFIMEMFDLVSEKTKTVLSKGLFEEFIYHCRGYDILLKNHANSLAMDPNLLEYVIININTLTQCTENKNDKFNKEFKRLTGYDVRRNGMYFTFDKGIYHANLKMDSSFIQHHFDEISYKLNEIMIYGLYLRGKNSNKEYHGTIYYLMEIMNSILGPKVEIQRFKGLGEMCIDDLSETVVNPMSRMLTKVTMEDAEKAERSMQIFMSDNNIKLKRLYYAGKVDFE